MQQHKALAVHSVHAVASELRLLLQNTRRMANKFVQQNNDLLLQLDKDPDNEARYHQLRKSLADRFPGIRKFSISNSKGQIQNIDSGENLDPVCLKNIQQHMIDRYTFVMAAHSEFGEFHFDIMVPWTYKDINKNILFTDYRLDEITRLLSVAQTEQHQLILTSNNDPRLIEITTTGDKDATNKSRPGRLTDSDISRLAHSQWVEETDWILRDIYDEQLLPNYRLRLWRPLIGAWIVVLLMTGLSLFFIRKAELSPPPFDKR